MTSEAGQKWRWELWRDDIIISDGSGIDGDPTTAKAMFWADSSQIRDLNNAVDVLNVQAAEIAQLRQWKDVITDIAVVDWVLTNENAEDAYKCIKDIVQMRLLIELDPAVSEQAAELATLRAAIDTAKEEIAGQMQRNGELLVEALELRAELAEAQGKAALADEEWQGTDAEVGTWEDHNTSARGPHRHCRFCNGQDKHTAKCRKARYDAALTTVKAEGS